MNTTPKERPILFSAPMVRAILDVRKTQTRRVMKPQPRGIGPSHWYYDSLGDWWTCGDNTGDIWKCPYGRVGGRLWVRETWRTGKNLDDHSPKQIEAKAAEFGYATSDSRGNRYPACPLYYLADGAHRKWGGGDLEAFGGPGKPRPSIHMPRWASRLTLEITGVRVERLNAISEADSMAEGDPVQGLIGSENTHKDWFRNLWQDTYGPSSWEANPWVWVVEFKRIGQ